MFNTIDNVGNKIPSVKNVFNYFHYKYKYPQPHFRVTFEFAYFFARLMQLNHRVIQDDPFDCACNSITIRRDQSN